MPRFSVSLVPSLLFAVALLFLVAWPTTSAAQTPVESEMVPGGAHFSGLGYYRQPTLWGDTVVFTAEGDLWKVSAEGGVASRLTSHLAQERHAALSPDGQWVAFSAAYEGGAEAYAMPLAGGSPRRLTWNGGGNQVVGWSPSGEVLVSTFNDSTLPVARLKRVSLTGEEEVMPLDWAADGTWVGETFYFSRFLIPRSRFKQYQGGRAQSIWSWSPGSREAEPVLVDHPGHDRQPMNWESAGRVVFVSDRIGALNLWSMALDGSDLQQHTDHSEWDVRWPSLSGDRVVYQLGADLRILHLPTGEDRLVPITLASDFDQKRSRWVEDPMSYLTDAEISPDGSKVVLTARGQVFVVPVKHGRTVEASREPSSLSRAGYQDGLRADGARHRNARFFPDGERLLSLSDASGEVELWELDGRGVAEPKQLTDGATVLRHRTSLSPDGRFAAYIEHDNDLWVFDIESSQHHLVESSRFFGFGSMDWSPDSAWLAYSVPAENDLNRIRLFDVASQGVVDATSDRFVSDSPAFSADGKWLYFVSERNLATSVSSPWGPYAPQPHLDKTSRLFLLDLVGDQSSPFAAPNELDATTSEAQQEPVPETENKKRKRTDAVTEEASEADATVTVLEQGLQTRLHESPLAPSSYTGLTVTKSHLFFLETDGDSAALKSLKLEHGAEAETVTGGVDSYWMSEDDSKVLVRSGDALYVGPGDGSTWGDLASLKLDLSGWALLLDPHQEWTQMMLEAWRLHRDYFYDPDMNGVDWDQMLAKYEPLVERVTDRAELSDIFGELIGELSASHHYVGGGDWREGPAGNVSPASLGARFSWDAESGGFIVSQLYDADPDLPEEISPLTKAGVVEGETILAVNGRRASTVSHLGELLRRQEGKQVLLQVASTDGLKTREVIVEPISLSAERSLRYSVWEYERRMRVETSGDGQLGYVHLRAMGARDWTQFARHYFPVAERPGLIIDVRNNNGGNIDSWILGFLLRRPWMWWTQRAGKTYHNMQYAFAGHVAVLCNEQTWSDGEAFCEGFKRLGLGPAIGKRTGGGEIWLTGSNVLVDRGVATAAEFGVYGPEGEWIVEGHGVEPDIEVDNLPHATFNGEDRQLEAAVEYLLKKIEEEPVERPLSPFETRVD